MEGSEGLVYVRGLLLFKGVGRDSGIEAKRRSG
jgi:hypothetical protein